MGLLSWRPRRCFDSAASLAPLLQRCRCLPPALVDAAATGGNCLLQRSEHSIHSLLKRRTLWGIHLPSCACCRRCRLLTLCRLPCCLPSCACRRCCRCRLLVLCRLYCCLPSCVCRRCCRCRQTDCRLHRGVCACHGCRVGWRRRLYELGGSPECRQPAHSRVGPLVSLVLRPRRGLALWGPSCCCGGARPGCCSRLVRCFGCCSCACCRTCRCIACTCQARLQGQAVDARGQLFKALKGHFQVQRRQRAEHEASIGCAGRMHQQAAAACKMGGRRLVTAEIYRRGSATGRYRKPCPACTPSGLGQGKLGCSAGPEQAHAPIGSRPNHSVRVAACQYASDQGPLRSVSTAGTSVPGAPSAASSSCASLAPGEAPSEQGGKICPLNSRTLPPASTRGEALGSMPRSWSSEP